MGRHEVSEQIDDQRVRAFTRAMLEEVRALEEWIAAGGIESGIQRVGLEQEMFLIGADGRPAPKALEVLEQASDDRLTTELALFNLEANLPPRLLGGSFLRSIETELDEVMDKVSRAASAVDADPLLTGILPSLRIEDLGLHNMTPKPRYRQLNDALVKLRGEAFSVFIRGKDLLELKPDNVMFESANTSLQLHLQSDIDNLPALYNLAQLVSAPMVAAAANSPVVFGQRLWHETRVALFERSVDARSEAERMRGKHPRVTFGSDWLQDPVELFRDSVARFPIVLVDDVEPPGEGPPTLAALNLHGGTVWRWNRVCYGVAEGVAHVRIENRVLPAGPTVLDEMANAALFYGLMHAMAPDAHSIPERLPFDKAHGNFVRAARDGLGAEFAWFDERRVRARDLLLEELIPLASQGLADLSVPREDIDRYLGTLEERVQADRNGARWLHEAYSRPSVPTLAICRVLHRHQESGEPVHRWPAPPEQKSAYCVADVMTRDVFTVRPEDVVDLAAALMTWKHFRHVPVESSDGRLVGLLSHRALLLLQERRGGEGSEAVEEVMDRDPLKVPPDLPLGDAIRRVLGSLTGCLLVVENDRLIGIATERDLLRAALKVMDRGAARRLRQ
ncbi:MAG: CBS domain-containing protein [Acidobacteriota bacterium]